MKNIYLFMREIAASAMEGFRGRGYRGSYPAAFCIVMAIGDLVLSFGAVISNIYHASGGGLYSLNDITYYWTEDDTNILVMCAIAFVYFMWNAWSLKRKNLDNHIEEA